MDVKNFKFLKSDYSKARGLMFSNKLEKRCGVVLVNNKEDLTCIHMFFVFFSIDVAFLNSSKIVVDLRKNIKPFTFLIKPRKKAKYIVEMNSGDMKNLKIGDKFNFK